MRRDNSGFTAGSILGGTMYRTTLGLALASLFFPTIGHTADSTTDSLYSYAQGTYTSQDLDTDLGDDDADGFGLSASWLFLPNAYVFARGDFTSPDKGDDARTFSIGAGHRLPIADIRSDLDDAGQIDAYVEASYENLEYESSFGLSDTQVEGDSDGFGATLGIRWLTTPNTELNPYIGYVNYGEPDIEVRGPFGRSSGSIDETLDGIRFGVRGVLDLTPRVSIVAGFERTQLDVDGTDIDITTLRAGLRWYFPSSGITVR